MRSTAVSSSVPTRKRAVTTTRSSSRLRIDVLDAVDALDDVFERARDEFDRLVGLVAVGGDHDVDHRHADLRLLLARKRQRRERAREQRRDQQQRRERRVDEGAGQDSRKARASWRHQLVAVLEARREFRRSRAVLVVSPGCTTTSSPPASRT